MRSRWKFWFAEKAFFAKEAIARPWRRAKDLVRRLPRSTLGFFSWVGFRIRYRKYRLRQYFFEFDRTKLVNRRTPEEKILLAEQKRFERRESWRSLRRGLRFGWENWKSNTRDFIQGFPTHWRNRREEIWWMILRRLTIGTGLTALVLGLVFGGAYFWLLPTYREWKAEVFYRNALAQIEEDDLRGAYLTLRLALVKDFGSLPVNLLMARWADQAGHQGNAMFYRQRIATELLPGDEEQVLAWINSAEQFKRPDKVLEAMAYLPWERQRATGMDWIHYQALRTTGADTSADLVLSRILEAEPDHELARLEALLLALRHGPEDKRFAGIEKALLSFADRDEAHARTVYLRLLETYRQAGYFPEAIYWGNRLEPMLQPEEPERVLLWEVMASAGAERAAGRLSRELESIILNAPELTVLRTNYSFALLRQGRIEDARALYDVLRGEFPQDVLFHLEYARILLRLEAWEEMVTMLRPMRWGSRDYLRNALLARANRALALERDAQEEWFIAQRKALADQFSARVLTNLAGEFGWVDEQFVLMREILRRYPGEEWVLNPLIRHFSRRGNYAELEQFLTHHLFVFPPSPDHPLVAFQDRWRLLREAAGDLRRERLEERWRRAPDDVNLTINVLLAAFQAEDHLRIREVLDGISAEEMSSFARLAWYVAIFEMLVGDEAKGRSLWYSLPQIPLLPEEADLEKRALIRMQIAGRDPTSSGTESGDPN